MVKKGTKRPRKLAKPSRFPLIERELRKRTQEFRHSDGLPILGRQRHAPVKAAGGGAAKWAAKMQEADRVGFFCDTELAELGGKS